MYKSRIYHEDLELLTKLPGFSLNGEIGGFIELAAMELPHGKKVAIGHILTRNEDSSIKYQINLTVEAWPAQFWTADVLTCEDKAYRLGFGSGSLTTYLPHIMVVAEGMMHVEPLVVP